jgi:hypothetical protein
MRAGLCCNGLRSFASIRPKADATTSLMFDSPIHFLNLFAFLARNLFRPVNAKEKRKKREVQVRGKKWPCLVSVNNNN